MRIGQFAETYDVTQDTVRYYLERGLLVARKRGEQYYFTEADGRDLAKILELKNLEFSLNCIQDILMTQRLSGENTDVYRQRYLACLEQKQEQVENERVRYEKLGEQIREKILRLKSEQNLEGTHLGFPLSSLGLLSCPGCREPLTLAEGTFAEHMIMEAALSCTCGFKARIHKGVYIEDACIRPKRLGDEPMPTKEEFLASSSHTYVNHLYQTMAAMVKFLQAGPKPNFILELNNCVGFFLMQYIQDLPASATYILVDHDLDRMMRMKQNLELYDDHRRFLFLCCDYHRLPLADGSVDCMVDNGMSRTYQIEAEEYLPSLLHHLLADGGIYISASMFFGENSRRDPASIPPRGWYQEREILRRLTDAGLSVEETTQVGPAFQEGNISKDFIDMEIYQLIVRSIKQVVPWDPQ